MSNEEILIGTLFALFIVYVLLKLIKGNQNKQNQVKRQISVYDIDHAKMNIDDRYIEVDPIDDSPLICSAKDTRSNNRRVIIKKLSRAFDTVEDARRTYRELSILKYVKHDNVIKLLDVYANSENISELKDVYLVTNYMPTNLAAIIRDYQLGNRSLLTEDKIRNIIYQLLRGLKYLHSCNIVHRDLKPQNIALDNAYNVRIIDFGLARVVNEEMTGYVATRRYRAPELLLIARDDNYYVKYTEAIDIWSIGCIMGELYKGEQLFKTATNKLIHLELILSLIGYPSVSSLKKLDSDYEHFFKLYRHRIRVVNFRDYFSNVRSEHALDLLQKMLKFDHEERITYDDAISHPFFEGYHDEDDEPIGDKFHDEFSKVNHKIDEWKVKILEEIRTFTPPSNDTDDDVDGDDNSNDE